MNTNINEMKMVKNIQIIDKLIYFLCVDGLSKRR